MDYYEYHGEKVIAIGIDEKGNHFIETTDDYMTVAPNTSLQGGAMLISLEEVCGIYDVHHAGQTAYNPRRG